ncbi:MAG: FtsX-like permease family protein [Acidobacteria bacterium]|nr:FtsX-like permease family protein [Acidobacteriota bacterium]
MFRHLSLIFRNSIRNRRRSLLTIVSIGVSLCLLGLLIAIYRTFYFSEATPDQALRLVTRNRVSLANPLPLSYEQRIKQVSGVKEVTIFQWFGGTYKDARDPANFFARFATEADKYATIYPENKLSETELKAFNSEPTACIVGYKTAQKHNLKLGDRITIVGDIFPVNLELVLRGIYTGPTDNETLYFHYKYLNESLTKSSSNGMADQVGTFVIRMERPEDANSISKSVDDMFRNSTAQTKTETEQAFGLSFLSFLGDVKLILLSICAAVTFTILLVSGNTMAMSVRERVREVGVLKTLGFTNGAVLWLLIGEAIIIALIGGAVGIALASGLCALIRTLPSTFADLSQLRVTFSVAAICLLVAGMIGLISSFIPAWGASRRPIIDALKFSD